MRKWKLSKEEIERLTELRKTGHSLPEIHKVSGRAYGTVFRYIKDVAILPEYQELWRVKRGGSKYRAFRDFEEAKQKAKSLLSKIEKRDRLFILAALYWGEGTKRELNLINGDPELIRVFVFCLRGLGITNSQMKINLRIFEDMDKGKVIMFWAKTLGIKEEHITSVDVLKGKKRGKLEHGMCRVRVEKSKNHFKFIMAMIDFIKLEINAAVVQRIERGFPKP